MTQTNRSNTRVALITGAGSGFGLLTSVSLAKRGFRVFATMRDLTKKGPLEDAAAHAGVTVEVLALDVTDVVGVARAVELIDERAGGIDLLVNNAGIGLVGSFEDTQDEELRRVFETNFFGACNVTRAIVPGMRTRRRGCIVNVSSVGGMVGSPAMAAYSPSKFALEGLSEVLSLELAPFGIKVVIVEPGAFKTEMIGPKRQMAARASDPSSPYHNLSVRIAESMERMFNGDDSNPQAVADTIVEAATAERPRLRYRVGQDAHAMAVLKGVLPARTFEKTFSWVFERMTMRSSR